MSSRARWRGSSRASSGPSPTPTVPIRVPSASAKSWSEDLEGGLRDNGVSRCRRVVAVPEDVPFRSRADCAADDAERETRVLCVQFGGVVAELRVQIERYGMGRA